MKDRHPAPSAGSDDPTASRRRGVRVTFQAKILLALVGTVVVLVGSSLWVIRQQMDAQVLLLVERTTDRAGRAMAEVEQLRSDELQRIGRRFTESIRVLAAMDAALAEDDPDVLADVAGDELALAGLRQGLASFSDLDGSDLVSLVDGEVVRSGDARAPTGGGAAGSDRMARRLLESGEVRLTGYEILDGRLYSVQVYLLALFGEPLGTLTLGFPLDDEVARRLREVVDSEVCFVVAGACLAGTAAGSDAELRTRMEEAADRSQAVVGEWGARRWALASQPLGGEEDVRQVLAVPLDDVLAPFDRIQRVERFAGLGAVLLAILLGVALSRGLTGPVRTLVSATDRVRRGEYDFRVDVRSRDEMRDLGDAFNGMLADLALKERYRGVLDKVLSRDVAAEMLRGEIRLGGEVRDVTTLFADVRGFTALSEGMESRGVIAMLNEWFDEVAGAVEAEGGIVDKFMGDGVMAVFGAPIAQPDHAARAVRAALAIRDDLSELNRRRAERGEEPIRVGIGLATGPVVAGNTGARDRLNYTVLGESVNLAARLCSAAGPGRILAAESTRRAAELHGWTVEGEPREPLRLKGVSAPIRPWRVEGARKRPSPAAVSTLAGALSAALLLGGLAAPTGAQTLPTLADLGVEYISDDGELQLLASGQLDLEGYAPGARPPWLVPETGAFPAGRLRLFLDLYVGERIYASVEGRADRGEAPAAGAVEARLQQVFIRFTPRPDGLLSVQAGKFVSPFGNLPMRRRTDADPFIRPPIGYDHRTVLDRAAVAGTADGFLGWRDDAHSFRPDGAPIVWDTPYPAGVLALGSADRLTYRLGVLNSAPSSEPERWDLLSAFDPTLVGHLGFQMIPELRIGASYSRGPYLDPEVEEHEAWGRSYAARSYRSYVQELVGIEATYTRGRTEVRAEAIHDRWEVPNVAEDAVDLSWFLEARQRFLPGLFGAVRYSAITYNELTRSDGERVRWDHPVRRWQVAAGYRLARNAEVRGEYLVNRADPAAELDTGLASIQLWWRF